MFQSTPGINAGRSFFSILEYPTDDCFNPRPASMPGDPSVTAPVDADVKFQSTPGINAGRSQLLRVVLHSPK